MNITKISPAVKTEGRYNVFVDNEFSFSLDETQLVTLGLKKGDAIDELQLSELKNESDFGKNYIRAVDLISRRLRSEREIRDYARRKQWTEDNTERVIDRLCERGYLNDERFAESFVRSRANTRNFSAKRMKVELQKKGVKPDIITNILAESDDYDEMAALRKMIAKKINKYDDERKLVAYLARQGFKYDDIKSALVDDEN
ncbi:MAG TPA: RecX family transcriptional regulator [Candidatus Nanoperiomorbaceae bacterium]|nr:RecX family transcriptional regulator [Candidatus Nanoperiomorbaceae bacterium]HMQ97131.1 RecX family transcriptional regulator [Candidatus Nanoperiomorbaceae bacterium]HMU12261.1 RecX family transcriptional regulator [Candidatus Nanoperiomorbaceae bacterium]